MKIGLGITTYERPEYLKKCLEGVVGHLLPELNSCYLYNDGSKDPEYEKVYRKMPANIKVCHAAKNRGVAHAKNWLLRHMMDDGCDYMFLAEDDIVPLSPKAVTEYVRLSEKSGIEHMMFAHHGEANKDKRMLRKNGIDLYRNPIGAWCMYTKCVIEEVGYFDENFINAWEHVEHSWRIAKAGYTPHWGASVVDLSKSKQYLKEIPGSIEGSSIRPRSDWMANNINGLIYWRNKDRDFPLQHILDGLLREEEAEYQRLGKENPRYA